MEVFALHAYRASAIVPSVGSFRDGRARRRAGCTDGTQEDQIPLVPPISRTARSLTLGWLTTVRGLNKRLSAQAGAATQL